MDEFVNGSQLVYYTDTRTVCAYLCVCPMRSREQNVISPRFFHQRKELLLVSGTNCLMSSLLERKVVNVPFAFLCVSTIDARNHAHHVAP